MNLQPLQMSPPLLLKSLLLLLSFQLPLQMNLPLLQMNPPLLLMSLLLSLKSLLLLLSF